MKLVTFSHRNGRHKSHAGMLDGDHVSCLTEAGIAGSVLEIITGGAVMLDASAMALPSRRAIHWPI